MAIVDGVDTETGQIVSWSDYNFAQNRERAHQENVARQQQQAAAPQGQDQGFVAPSPQPAAAPSFDYGELFNQQAALIDLQQAQNIAQQAYLNKRIELVDVPGLEVEKERIAREFAARQAELELRRQQEAARLTFEQQQEANRVSQQQALLAEQQRQFNEQQRLQQAGLSGFLESGAPTLAREELQQVEARRQLDAALGASNLLAQLRGPADAFAQQRALYGLNQAGIPNAVAALSGQFTPPSFQAPQALPQAATLATLSQQLATAGQAGGDPNNTAGILAALPNPNQVVGRNFLRLTPDTQQFLLGAFEAKGFSPTDVLQNIQAGLPQFQAPAFGSVG